jgi:hypothetical protein
MEEVRNVYNILVGETEGKRSLGRPRHVSEDNIKMDIKEISWAGVDWIHLAQDGDPWQAPVNIVMTKMAVFWVVAPCSLVEVYQPPR